MGLLLPLGDETGRQGVVEELGIRCGERGGDEDDEGKKGEEEKME